MTREDLQVAPKTLRLKDGRVISYAEYGDPSGHPIFVFHGTPGSRVFARVLDAAAVSGGVRLVSPDRPGYGRSSAWTGGLLDYPEDVVQLADALGLHQFGVLGVSGGAPYSLACAWRIPYRLTGAGLVSGIGPLYLKDATREMVAANRWILSTGRYSPRLTGFLLLLMTRFTLFSMRKHLQNGTSPMPDMSPDLFALVMADQRTAFQTGGHGVAFDMRSLWYPWASALRMSPSRSICGTARTIRWHRSPWPVLWPSIFPTAMPHSSQERTTFNRCFAAQRRSSQL